MTQKKNYKADRKNKIDFLKSKGVLDQKERLLCMIWKNIVHIF
jgi:hypothetical protein